MRSSRMPRSNQDDHARVHGRYGARSSAPARSRSRSQQPQYSVPRRMGARSILAPLEMPLRTRMARQPLVVNAQLENNVLPMSQLTQSTIHSLQSQEGSPMFDDCAAQLHPTPLSQKHDVQFAAFPVVTQASKSTAGGVASSSRSRSSDAWHRDALRGQPHPQDPSINAHHFMRTNNSTSRVANANININATTNASEANNFQADHLPRQPSNERRPLSILRRSDESSVFLGDRSTVSILSARSRSRALHSMKPLPDLSPVKSPRGHRVQAQPRRQARLNSVVVTDNTRGAATTATRGRSASPTPSRGSIASRHHPIFGLSSQPPSALKENTSDNTGATTSRSSSDVKHSSNDRERANQDAKKLETLNASCEKQLKQTYDKLMGELETRLASAKTDLADHVTAAKGKAIKDIDEHCADRKRKFEGSCDARKDEAIQAIADSAKKARVEATVGADDRTNQLQTTVQSLVDQSTKTIGEAVSKGTFTLAATGRKLAQNFITQFTTPVRSTLKTLLKNEQTIQRGSSSLGSAHSSSKIETAPDSKTTSEKGMEQLSVPQHQGDPPSSGVSSPKERADHHRDEERQRPKKLHESGQTQSSVKSPTGVPPKPPLAQDSTSTNDTHINKCTSTEVVGATDTDVQAAEDTHAQGCASRLHDGPHLCDPAASTKTEHAYGQRTRAARKLNFGGSGQTNRSATSRKDRHAEGGKDIVRTTAPDLVKGGSACAERESRKRNPSDTTPKDTVAKDPRQSSLSTLPPISIEGRVLSREQQDTSAPHVQSEVRNKRGIGRPSLATPHESQPSYPGTAPAPSTRSKDGRSLCEDELQIKARNDSAGANATARGCKRRNMTSSTSGDGQVIDNRGEPPAPNRIRLHKSVPVPKATPCPQLPSLVRLRTPPLPFASQQLQPRRPARPQPQLPARTRPLAPHPMRFKAEKADDCEESFILRDITIDSTKAVHVSPLRPFSSPIREAKMASRRAARRAIENFRPAAAPSTKAKNKRTLGPLLPPPTGGTRTRNGDATKRTKVLGATMKTTTTTETKTRTKAKAHVKATSTAKAKGTGAIKTRTAARGKGKKKSATAFLPVATTTTTMKTRSRRKSATAPNRKSSAKSHSSKYCLDDDDDFRFPG